MCDFLEDNWIVSPFVFVERNPDLGLTLRSAAVLVAGRYLQRSNSSAHAGDRRVGRRQRAAYRRRHDPERRCGRDLRDLDLPTRLPADHHGSDGDGLSGTESLGAGARKHERQN